MPFCRFSYPEKIIADFHHAYCYIPPEIVHIVQTIPNIVGKAVKAFYERDPLDVKVRGFMFVCYKSLKVFLKAINPIHATSLSLYPLKTSENLWFLMFSGGIERDQWCEMG